MSTVTGPLIVVLYAPLPEVFGKMIAYIFSLTCQSTTRGCDIANNGAVIMKVERLPTNELYSNSRPIIVPVKSLVELTNRLKATDYKPVRQDDGLHIEVVAGSGLVNFIAVE